MGFGMYLKDYLEFNNISQSEFASRLGISQKHINEILNEKTEITLDMAASIELLTGIPISFIIKSQHRKNITEKLLQEFGNEKAINEKLKKEFCLKELNDRMWVNFKDITNPIQNYMDIIEFLKVKDFRALSKLQEKTLFKKQGTDLNKLNLWIARADELSRNQKVKEYNSVNLNFLIEEILEIAYNDENNIEKLTKTFNNYGIYFIVEKALAGTKVRGCFKVRGKNPAIYITQNYNGKDSFYFEIFHELGHCKRDYNEAKSKVIVEGNEMQEKKADEFALNIMIDKEIWNYILENYSEKNIIAISKKYKIPICFIVGRLAKNKKIKYSDNIYRKYCALK